MNRSLVASVVFPVCVIGAVVLLRLVEQHWVSRGAQAFRLRFPRDMDAEAVTTFVAGLSAVRPPWFWRWLRLPTVILEIHAHRGVIEHFLVLPTALEGIVLSHLRAALPSVRLDPPVSTPLPELMHGLELRVSARHRPLRTDRLGGVSAALLSSLQPLDDGEHTVVQWLLTPLSVPRPPRLPDRGKREEAAGLAADGYGLSPHGEALRAERAKQAEPLYLVVGRLAVSSVLLTRGKALLDRMVGSYQLLTAAGVELRRRHLLPRSPAARRVEQRRVPAVFWPSGVLNASEIVGVMGWPVGITQMPGLELGGCPDLPPAIDIPSEGLVIGRSTYPGDKRPIAISDLDRNTHISVTGPTGSGKSVLLAGLIEQDMRSGRGCVVIDVKGSLVDECLRRVPDDRLEDVIVLDPSDEAQPVGINLLSTAYASKELVADQVVQVFKALFEDGWGPRSDDLLRACCLTLMQDPAMTLVEIVPLLMNEAFRRRFMGLVKDDTIGLAPFWSLFGSLKPNERIQTISPLLNKCRQILLRPAVRNCVGQSKTTLDLGAALDSGKLLFIPLPEGVLGDEAASLLGSLLVSRIYSATQSRIAQPEAERRPVTLYLDEAHRLTGSAIGLENLLAQARATKLSVVLATQFLQQYPPDIRLAVLSNARSKILYQPTAKDAQLYAAELKPFVTAEELQGLRRFEVVAQLVANQRVTEPVTATTAPPTAETGNGDRARAQSRKQYGRKREDIEAELKARHAIVTTSAPIGRQRKQTS